jgi:hypothetical protein
VTVTGDMDIAANPELSTVLAWAAAAPGSMVVLDLGPSTSSTRPPSGRS